MPEFVHTADIHLDTPYSAHFTQKQMQLRRKEQMQTFQEIVYAAKDRDFLFISGDLFDGRFVSADTMAFVKRCFAEIPNTHVLIAAGNHDPYHVASPYTKTEFGEHVHVFSKETEYLDFPECKTRVHGVSFSKEHQEETKMHDFEIKPDWCNLLVVHGEVVADQGESLYHPIRKSDIEASGMDYIALGHIHQYSGLVHCGASCYAYPGIPEGRGFDETGPRGYLVGRAERGHAEAEWIPCNRRSFWELHLDVSKIEDSIALLQRIEEAVKQQGSTEDIYKIHLEGRSGALHIDPEVMAEQGRDLAFYLTVRDETQKGTLAEEVAGEHSLRGDFVSAMHEAIRQMSEEEREIGALAMQIGLEAMDGGSKA